MRDDLDVMDYQELLGAYRDRAKKNAENAKPGSPELELAFKEFYRLDGAICVLNWVLRYDEKGVETELPPFIKK